MRVFLFSCGNISLAIPISFVSTVTVFHDNQDTVVDYDERFHNTYISLPALFNFPLEKIKHGIILKNGDNDNNDGNEFENRTIFLTTEIECETNIPEDKIHSIPKILKTIRSSFFINGIVFAFKKEVENQQPRPEGRGIKPLSTNKTADIGSNVILLVNPVQILKNLMEKKND